MSGADGRPACARVAATDPVLADRMWHTVGVDGREVVDPVAREAGIRVCEACAVRDACVAAAVAGGWKDRSVYGGLDYRRRWILARLVARDLDTTPSGLHSLAAWRIARWLRAHRDWPDWVVSEDREYNRVRRRASRAANHAVPSSSPGVVGV